VVGARRFTRRLHSYGRNSGTGHILNTTELSGRRQFFTYDAIFRLKQEQITAATPSGTISYTFDAVSNRLSRTSTVAGVPSVVHTYDANDRLTADTYDANGNTLATAGWRYTYDFENRLVGATGGVSILYDGDGNRVAKTVGSVTTR